MKRPALGVLWIAALLALAAPMAASALTFRQVNFEPGLLLIGNTDEPSTGPTPLVLTQSLGASLPAAISGPFFVEPSVSIFGTWYEYTGTRAVPGAVESGSSFFVLGTLLALRAGAAFPVSERVSLGAAVGLDLLVRIPIDVLAGAADRADDRRASLAYFYGMARFLYPETSLFCTWRLAERFGLAFSLRAMHPLFHLWDGEGLSYVDQLLLAGQVGFTYSFR